MARINIVNADNKIESNPRRAYFKLKNTGGPKGDTGAQGPQGPKGDTGAQGPAGLSASVTVGSTTTLAPGASATVTNSGDTRNAVLNFGIPTGAQGPQGVQGPKGDTGPEGAKGAKGDTGAAATVTVANTNTGAPGTNASVENVGDEHNAVLNFTIPRGDKGETGATGAQGPAGQDGKDFTPTVVTALPETGENGVLYMTEKAHTTQTATGNPITATIADDAGKIEDFQLDGDTFQQSYTGKNLLNFVPVSNQGMTVTYDAGTGVAHVSGTNSSPDGKWANICQPVECLLPAGTYTLSVTKAQSNMDFHLRVKYQDNSTGDFVIGRNNTSKTFTTSKDTKQAYIWYGGLTPTYSSVDFTVGVQLEADSSASSFEPYVGGIPSPNPDYPQPIQTVTGTQTVAVTGKNLFDKDYPTEHYYYDASGNKVTDSRNDWINQAIPVSEKLTFSFASKTGSNCYVRLVELNSGAFIKRTLVNTTGTTITLDASTTDVIASVDAGPTNYFTDLQIEAGPTATAYAPYSEHTYQLDLGSIELNDLGDGYQDEIAFDGAEWKLRKATHKLTLDGSSDEGWTSTGTNVFASLSNGSIDVANVPTGLCSHAKFNPVQTSVTSTLANGEFAIQMNNPGRGRIFFKNTAISTVNDFKTWLATNLPEIVYNAYTPTETIITDSTLIAQLEAIRTALLENGANTIANTAEGSNLAGDMEIGYYGYTPTSQYDKWIWLDVGAAGAHYEQI
jgi:hypothetical protein